MSLVNANLAIPINLALARGKECGLDPKSACSPRSRN
jgi:hypothetical protein